jgi:hypothetical protein
MLISTARGLAGSLPQINTDGYGFAGEWRRLIFLRMAKQGQGTTRAKRETVAAAVTVLGRAFSPLIVQVLRRKMAAVEKGGGPSSGSTAAVRKHAAHPRRCQILSTEFAQIILMQ